MFRNQYDQDVLSWSPHGRLHQVEYAVEAVTQGSTVVGCKGSDSVVIAALKRSSSDLAARHEKLFAIGDNAGVAVSGLVSDGQQLATVLRNAAINSNFVFNKEARISRLSTMTAKRLQACTQHSSRRPYGVGILLAGSDDKGIHLHHLLPTGDVHECEGVGIGTRSQAARTYLEKYKLSGIPSEELVWHCLRALREACPDRELDAACCSVGVVYESVFRILPEPEVMACLKAMDTAEK
ncbi:nucleophile aminohydrolase [Ostreococcus tauri]|uniref:Proteasome subunit alpha type n=1 Tax=Ostreococcus tauri TaxID=70448 RepID=A0A1Y5I1T8_OSTTA|nr:nucleophile aminohydrolase [Ostreococcus tauri]